MASAAKIQKKSQAEPEKVNGIAGPPRWVGSGWTIFNNKGKPVRKYEPFFSTTHRFDFGVQVGVSPILFYDPVERVVATLHPNHTYEKVVFGPWQQTTYDVNDCVLGDPRTDADIRGYTAGYFASLPASPPAPPWQTWHAQRQGGALGAQEQSAASKAAAHADTPTMAYYDTLGRPFLTLADNGPDPAQPGTHLHFATRVELDIEGNQRAVRDAIDQAGDKQGRIVMRYAYDRLGNRIHQLSMEAGARWMINDVAGKSLYAWDSRNHQFRTAYDPLRRPTDSFLREGAGAELLVGRTVYGETRPNPETNNLRGMVVQLFDQAGIVISVAYDFKGNLLEGRRQLAQEYKATLNWSVTVPLEADIYTSRTTYDALNRPLTATSPDGSVYRPTFNEANLLDKVDVNLRGAAAATSFVKNIDYDAKGQRERIEYGNGVSTKYEYDKDTFRVIHLKTSRNSDSATLQDLSYTYDPVGNITSIEDKAQQRILFDNECVVPIMSYAYDAIYRLAHATGREHIGQVGQPTWSTWDDAARIGLPHPNECAAMRNYTEDYNYDAGGNFLSLVHAATNGNWTRSYAYSEPSLIEPGKKNNRLSNTTVGNNNPPVERYVYDAHGNMTRMPHLGGAHPAPNMHWDYRDQLRQTDLGGGGTAYYVYDAAGQRVRKVWKKSATLIEERIYLGGFEIFRRHGGAIGANTATLERETLHLMDDKQRIALVETRTLDTTGNDPAPPQVIRYQFGNHLGSASLELDDQAEIISYEEYFPYGNTSYQAARSQTETPKRYRYTGKERDEESGLYYHGARYYAPWVGRWTRCDPAELVDGTNRYRYAWCNPIRFTDPSGTTGAEYTVRSNPEKVFGENPNARRNFNSAVEKVLERQFRLGSLEKNLAALKNKINSLDPEGPQQIDKRLNLKSQKGFARSISNKVNARFYRNEAASPSWPYSKPQRALLNKGQAPDPRQQIEHLKPLGKNLEGFLNVDDMYFTEGGVRGAIPRDSPHGEKTWGKTGKRLAAWEAAAAEKKAPTKISRTGQTIANSAAEQTSPISRGTGESIDEYEATLEPAAEGSKGVAIYGPGAFENIWKESTDQLSGGGTDAQPPKPILQRRPWDLKLKTFRWDPPPEKPEVEHLPRLKNFTEK